MEYRIVYKRLDGGISIISPAPETLERYTIDQIARKDVPPGRPYKIVPVNEIPTDRTFRAAWDIDDASLTDGVGNDSNTFEDPQ